MDTTPNLDLPYILAAQAQKHVTHNEALRLLDALVQLMVLDRDQASPPPSPTNGVRYIVADSPTGAWTGRKDQIAAWQDGSWSFIAPREGFLAWVADENSFYVFDGAAWVAYASGVTSVNPVSMVGINTTADATNKLAVKANAALFSHDDVTPGTGDMRVKINKQASGNVASLLFQRGFSGRAEIGLMGNESLSFKVSNDGTTFRTPMTFNSDGSVSYDLANPNNGAALSFQKARSSTLSYRIQYVDIGGFIADANGGAYWRGVMMAGPLGGIVYSGVQTYPSCANYFEYDAQTNPSVSRFIWDVANSNGNSHDLIFRINSLTDLLRLSANGTYVARSIYPTADNAITLGASGARFASIWSANGTIQTSDARDKDIVASFPTAHATALVDAVDPVLFRWKVGSNEVVEEYTHSVVPPHAGPDFDYAAALPKGETQVIPKAGRRVHAGFIAQDMKVALDATGLDFGAWGLERANDPESRQWLRPDQLIPVIWAALQETQRELAALRSLVSATPSAV